MSVDSVSNQNSVYVQSPVKENSLAAKVNDGQCQKVATVAINVFFILALLGSGITLITLGSLSVNPVFLGIGSGFLVLAAINFIMSVKN